MVTAKPTKLYLLYAIFAALLYAFATPISKLLLVHLSEYTLAGLLYLGAGILMPLIMLFEGKRKRDDVPIGRKSIKFIIAMVLLDVAAPILLLLGLRQTMSEHVSLINNFEIVATSLVAALVFKERITLKLWLGIIVITLATLMLSITDIASFSFSSGALLVVLATIAWGFENNCTRMLAHHNRKLIVLIKGLSSGTISLIIAVTIGQLYGEWPFILIGLGLGMGAYGLSILFYVKAQSGLGAARTSAFYSLAPFIGVSLAFIIFRDQPEWNFYVGLGLMMIGMALASEWKFVKKRAQDECPKLPT